MRELKVSFLQAINVVLPWLFLAALGVAKVVAGPYYQWLVAEDSLLESIQFISYLVSGLLFLVGGGWLLWSGRVDRQDSKLLGKVVVLSGVILLAVAAEEISWGQRVAHLPNPTFFAQHNVQSEISLHNLKPVQPLLHDSYIFLALVLIFGRSCLQWLSRFFKPQQHLVHELHELGLLLLPRLYFASYFAPIILIYSILMFVKPFGILLPNGLAIMDWRDQELAESTLAFGIMVQSLVLWQYWQSILPVPTTMRTFKEGLQNRWAMVQASLAH